MRIILVQRFQSITQYFQSEINSLSCLDCLFVIFTPLEIFSLINQKKIRFVQLSLQKDLPTVVSVSLCRLTTIRFLVDADT